MTRRAHELDPIIGAENVLRTEPDRIAYNADCWPRGLILSRGQITQRHLPEAIAQPHTVEQIQSIVNWARTNEVPLIPYGAGSGVCGGTLTTHDGIVVDMKHFNQIRGIDRENHLMDVETGIIGMNLETELQRVGCTLGHWPSSLYCSSVGGYIAGRSAGQFSTRFGKMEDMIESLRFVSGTGELIDTNDATFDVTPLIVGSEGTLGFITDATLRIEPNPEDYWYRGFEFEDVPAALDAIREMMQAGFRPAVVRLYDEFDSLIAKRKAGKKGNPVQAKLMSQIETLIPGEVATDLRENVGAVTKALMGRILGQPSALNAMLRALPIDCLMVVGFEGTAPSTEAEAHSAFEMLGRRGVDLGSEPGLHWRKHRMDVSYKQSAMYVSGAFVDTMEVSTTWSNLERLYNAVRHAVSRHAMVMAHFSHAYHGGCSIYFTFAGFGHTLDETLEKYEALWQDGLTAVAEAGGSVAHHHGVGVSKSGFTQYDHRNGRPLFEALKTTFDPDGILNPGKVWGDGNGTEAWP